MVLLCVLLAAALCPCDCGSLSASHFDMKITVLFYKAAKQRRGYSLPSGVMSFPCSASISFISYANQSEKRYIECFGRELTVVSVGCTDIVAVGEVM